MCVIVIFTPEKKRGGTEERSEAMRKEIVPPQLSRAEYFIFLPCCPFFKRYHFNEFHKMLLDFGGIFALN